MSSGLRFILYYHILQYYRRLKIKSKLTKSKLKIKLMNNNLITALSTFILYKVWRKDTYDFRYC